MRTARRPRRGVGRSVLSVLSPFYRYSDSREAWMLRGVGRWVGPVLVPREWKIAPEPGPAALTPIESNGRRFVRREDREPSVKEP
jgi:hypothetical protein